MLNEKRKSQLDGIVQEMIANHESDNNIQTVVDDFKSKYEGEGQPTNINIVPSSDLKNNSKSLELLKKAGDISGKVMKGASEVLFAPTVRAIETGLAQPIREVQRAMPGGRTGEEPIQTPFGEIKDIRKQSKLQTASQALDVAVTALPIEKLVKTPLTKVAEKLYQSALKPSNVVRGGKVLQTAEDIAKIGLKEKVWLTKGGVERVANKIDDFENILGDAIEKAGNQGKTINTQGLKSYIDEAKNFFSNQFNVQESEKAIQEIDNIYNGFIKKYGSEIPIEKAQQIKVATGQALRKYYSSMSSAGIEATKQGTRYLKEEIVKAAPIVGDINERLQGLYQFDRALQKASGRIGNLNLLGLGTKVGAAAAGSKGAVIGLLTDLADKASVKSGAAIALDTIGKNSGGAIKNVKVPVANMINKLIDYFSNND